MSAPQNPDRNLALELVRVTETAAIAAAPWVGRGEKNLADQAAVEAMREMINTVDMAGVVVIGEGEKDDAPMLHNGEHVGNGLGPACDVAVDPIDGTSNFLRGAAVWATLIALAIDGDPVVGVVSAPALGKRWWGSKGNGAWVDESRDPLANVPIPAELSEYLEQPMVAVAEPRKLEVSGVKDLADASISYNSIQQWDQAGYLDELVGLSRKVWRTRAYGDMWSYMMVAEGILDVAGEFDLKPYDMAALMPIVTEAGGTFTSIEGHGDIWHGSALATNGQLHPAVLAELAR